MNFVSKNILSYPKYGVKHDVYLKQDSMLKKDKHHLKKPGGESEILATGRTS